MPYGSQYGIVPRGGYAGLSGRRTAADVLRKRWEDDTNFFFKVLSGIAIGQQALAGMAVELQRREQGKPPKDLYQSVLRGIEEEESFRSITPNNLYGKVMGTTMDIVIDPANLLAVGPVAKIWANGTRGIASATGKALRSVKPIDVVAEKLGERFVPYYVLRKMGLADSQDIARSALGAMTTVETQKITNTARQITKLVPDIRRREELIKLRELRPPKGVDTKDAMRRELEFQEKYTRLTPNEREALEVFDSKVKELEEIKVGAELLEKAAMHGLHTKMQQRYWSPHYWKRWRKGPARREDVTIESAMEHLITAKIFKKNLEFIDQDLVKASETFQAVDDWVEGITDASKWNVLPKRVRDTIPKRVAQTPDNVNFMKQRSIIRRIPDMDTKMMAEIELDAAKLIDIAERDVAKAVIFKDYLKNMLGFLRDRGVLLTEDITKLPRSQWKFAAAKAGTRLSDQALSSQWEKLAVSGLDESLQGLMVPKGINEELSNVMRQYREPGAFMSVFRKVTGYYKAWTLAIFPSYHSRNLISNMWNNHLAGMSGGPGTMEAYRHATTFTWRSTFGKLSDEPVKIGRHRFRNEHELKELMMRERVIDAGQYSELDDVMRGVSHTNNIMNLANPNPAKNPAIRAGFWTGRRIEDHSRAAHFFWRLQKGDSIQDAVRSVNKYLFDYNYGLTSFEKKWMRDRFVPFYAWTRFNIPLQLEALIAQPYKYGNAYKVFQGVQDYAGGPDPDEVFLADFIKENASIRINWDEKKGRYTYFMLDSWWPAADIKKVISGPEAAFYEVMNMLNPILKAPVEAFMANYNLFKREKVERFPGERKEVAPLFTEEGPLFPLPARWEHMVRSVRLLNEIDRVIQAVEEEYTGSAVGGAFVRTFIGKAYPQSMEAQIKRWDVTTSEQLRELEGWLRTAERRGDARNIEKLQRAIEHLENERREHLGLF